MSLQLCSSCHKRQPGKYANTTVAWWNAANKRLAYRLKVCVECFAERIEPIRLSLLENEINCPYCHLDCTEDMDPCYITCFIPNFGKLQLEMGTCAVDAVVLRSWAVESGELLQDASVGGQGPSPQTPATSDDEWTRAGLNWRG